MTPPSPTPLKQLTESGDDYEAAKQETNVAADRAISDLTLAREKLVRSGKIKRACSDECGRPEEDRKIA